MSLEDARNQTKQALDAQATDELVVIKAAFWMMEVKNWEFHDTFEAAFDDGRMTARKCKTSDLRTDPIKDSAGGETPILYNAGVTGIKPRLIPTNFTDKKKNQLGLHDLSAVLLSPKRPIKLQLFYKDGYDHIIFMPIPLEEDLQLFDRLSRRAKGNRDGALYRFVVTSRARLTRIKYGSDEDMAIGFLNVKQADDPKTPHFRYGAATRAGNPIAPATLQTRAQNALNYKQEIVAKPPPKEGNNEVTVKYREHAGVFPYFGSVDGERYMVGREALAGWVDQSGRFQKATEADLRELKRPRPTVVELIVYREKVTLTSRSEIR